MEKASDPVAVQKQWFFKHLWHPGGSRPIVRRYSDEGR
jgi:hypothetical protein